MNVDDLPVPERRARPSSAPGGKLAARVHRHAAGTRVRKRVVTEGPSGLGVALSWAVAVERATGIEPA